MGPGFELRIRHAAVQPSNPETAEKRSLSQFTTLTAFVNWLGTSYRPNGGDDPELQLDALHYAALDMDNAVSPLKYIVLITDNTYHNNEGGSTVSLTQVNSELTTSGCPVFLSLWELPTGVGWLYDPTAQDPKAYNEVVLNEGEVDMPNYIGTDVPGSWKYPLAALRARILPDQ